MPTDSLANPHPKFLEFQEDWELCRDCHRGERVIKDAQDKYLPPTSAMCADGFPAKDTKGWRDYRGYIGRAVFRAYMKHSVAHNMGCLWHEPTTFELPPEMEPIRELATRKKESLEQLLRNIHEQCLITGRLGLHAAMPLGVTTEPVMPYINLYQGEKIINWDEGEPDQVVHDSLNLVVLDESKFVRRTNFEWEFQKQYRVLLLGDLNTNEEAVGDEESEQTANKQGGSQYLEGLFKEYRVGDQVEGSGALANKPGNGLDFAIDNMISPSFRGNKLTHIPFVFVNTRDVVPEPDDPPLLDLARQDLVIYRTEADYRQTLFMQGQYTLVIIGEGNDLTDDGTNQAGTKEVRTGAGAVLRLSNPQADAKFIGIEGQGGLSEQRTALENDNRHAEVRSGSMTDTRSNEKESGDAMKTRIAGETASLTTIAKTCAFALQTLLRSIAVWMGADPEKVIVKPNLNFSFTKLTPKDLLDLQTGKNQGLPISEESVHDNVRKSGLTELQYDEETEKLDSEEPRLPAMTAQAELDQETQDQAAQNNQEGAKTQAQLDEEAAQKGHVRSEQSAVKAHQRSIQLEKTKAAGKPKPGRK
jgi:hypothetical protein